MTDGTIGGILLRLGPGVRVGSTSYRRPVRNGQSSLLCYVRFCCKYYVDLQGQVDWRFRSSSFTRPSR
jgi:hypothetical protein